LEEGEQVQRFGQGDTTPRERASERESERERERERERASERESERETLYASYPVRV
jgi:hypothetical protein